jgi:hypothetical protein
VRFYVQGTVARALFIRPWLANIERRVLRETVKEDDEKLLAGRTGK